jgi:hypothetical protein
VREALRSVNATAQRAEEANFLENRHLSRTMRAMRFFPADRCALKKRLGDHFSYFS